MKKILLIGSVILVLVISFFLIRHLTAPKKEHPIYRPLPAHALQTPSGESVQIEKQFPNQDYLLLFFTETSPTSLTQLAEIAQVADRFPANLAVVLIHLGRMSQPNPAWVKTAKGHLLIDYEATLAQAMKIHALPTLFLLKNDYRQILFAERLVQGDELLTCLGIPTDESFNNSTP